ncbi:MAG: hypothetical protein RSE59_04060, partial [Clostridia bacterium]
PSSLSCRAPRPPSSAAAQRNFFGNCGTGIAGLRGIDEKRGRKSNKTRAVKKFTINIGIMPIAQTISHVL